MNTIRGIIFDCDGVLADTAELHYQAWQRVADDEGLTFSRSAYQVMSGTKREENLRLFTEGLKLDDATKQTWLMRKVRYFDELLETLQPGDALPGVVRLLREAQAAGLKLGVGSASRNARAIVERLRLSHYFSVIGDGTSVVNSKPAPDIFIWVAGALGLSPAQCLVIEDSQAGVQAGLQGGFSVVGVGDGPVHEAHVVYPTLADVKLKDLLQRVHDTSS